MFAPVRFRRRNCLSISPLQGSCRSASAKLPALDAPIGRGRPDHHPPPGRPWCPRPQPPVHRRARGAGCGRALPRRRHLRPRCPCPGGRRRGRFGGIGRPHRSDARCRARGARGPARGHARAPSAPALRRTGRALRGGAARARPVTAGGEPSECPGAGGPARGPGPTGRAGDRLFRFARLPSGAPRDPGPRRQAAARPDPAARGGKHAGVGRRSDPRARGSPPSCASSAWASSTSCPRGSITCFSSWVSPC